LALQGYSSGDPKKRINYVTGLSYVGILGLLGTTIKFAYDLLQQRVKQQWSSCQV